MKMKISFVSVVMVGVSTLFSTLAQATLTTIEITAEVTHVGDRLGVLEGNINVGDIITGTYAYDTSTPDLDPNPRVGRYEHYCPPCGISLQVGGFDFKTDPDNVEFIVVIENDILSRSRDVDRYRLESESNLPLSNGLLVDYIFLYLDGPSSVLSSDALPTTAPVLGHWYTSYDDIRISGNGRGSFTFYGNLTSAALIPEPATLALLGLGGLALLRKRRLQKQASLANKRSVEL